MKDIQCPVCGYYCLGNGGYGCIDKPSLVFKTFPNELETLRAKVAELEAQLDYYRGLEPVAWVSTLDRLPPDKTVVLAVVNGKIRLVERRWEYPTYEETFKAFWYWDDPNNYGQDWGIADVTHWMPIPLYALEE